MPTTPIPFSPKSLLLILMGLYSLTGAPMLSAQPMNLEEVLDAYVSRMGGHAALQRISSARLKGTITRPDGSTHDISVLKKKPDFTRVTVDTGRLQLVQAYNGQVAWYERRIGKRSQFGRMEGEEARSFIRGAPLTNHLVRHRQMEDLTMQLLEDRMLNNTPVYAVEARFANGARSIHLIEKETFIERRIFEFDSETGHQTTLIPSQFERHSGVDFAMRIIRKQDDETLSILDLDSVDINVGILNSAFDPPPEFDRIVAQTSAPSPSPDTETPPQPAD